MQQDITTTPRHTFQTFGYGLSIVWHKLSYYGWRSILVLFIFDELQGSSLNEVGTFIFYLSLWGAISYLTGGILGDLLLGNRRSSFIGALLIFTGSILFVIDSSITPNLPIFISVFGTGLYQSNIKALYTKLYLHDTRLLDSAFLLMTQFINVGSFLGTFLIGLVYDHYGAQYGFFLVAVSSLFSAITLLVFTKKETPAPVPQNKSVFNKTNAKSVGVILTIIAVYTIFWRLSYFDVYTTYWTMDISSLLYLDHYLVDTFSYIFYIIIGIFLIIIWSRKHYSHWTKLSFAIILILVSFVLSFAFHTMNSSITNVVTIISLLIYTLGELLIEPVIHTSIAKLVNRKYLAIGFGSISILSMLFAYLFVLINDAIELTTDKTFYIGIVGLLVLGIFLFTQKAKHKVKL